jgi:arylsulfatase A-like enzyme
MSANHDASTDGESPPASWSRREAVKALGAAGLASAVPWPSSSPARAETRSPTPEQPNIVFIVADDHAYGGLCGYGGRLLDTPHLNRIAEEGMEFKNAFITNAVCGPSRASMLTGKYSHKHGVLKNVFFLRQRSFDGSQMTVPKRLRAAGYTTLHVGKWHLGSPPTGFGYWKKLTAQGRYNNPKFREKTGPEESRKVRESGYVTDIITRDTIRAIEEHRDDGPFCAFCWHKAPHRSWIPAERHEDLFAEAPVPPPATFEDDYYSRASAAKHARMRIAGMSTWKRKRPKGLSDTERKHWNYQQYAKNYMRTVKAIDEGVGRLLDYLDEAGLAENTLVVYTSDNGMFIGEHGFYDKRFMYEESIRVPLLMRYPPLIEAGTVEDRIVRNVDFAPTFMDLAGVEIPEDVQGRSLRPLMEQRTDPDWDEPLYYHYYEYPRPHRVRRHYGIRTDRYKLIYYYRIQEWELFDLHRDPHELRNVVQADRYQEVFRNLKEELRAIRATYGDRTGKAVPK